MWLERFLAEFRRLSELREMWRIARKHGKLIVEDYEGEW
jgi:hypothetical protein